MSQIVFITGSTDGIGKLTARKLATAGHQVILHGRNADKLSTVVNDIKRDSGNDNVSGYIADLSDLSAVKQLAAKVLTDHPRIDVLINNAGVYMARQPRTAAGLDVRFLVNYLAPVVLTEALLPALRAATAPRVVSLSSAAQAPVSLAALRGKQQLPDQSAYAQSKLALTMWNTAMSEQHTDIAFIAVNPGSLLNTKMVREAFGRHYAPADKGADILVQLATASPHADKSGYYFDNDRGGYGPAHPDATDAQEIEALIAVTEQLTA